MARPSSSRNRKVLLRNGTVRSRGDAGRAAQRLLSQPAEGLLFLSVLCALTLCLIPAEWDWPYNNVSVVKYSPVIFAALSIVTKLAVEPFVAGRLLKIPVLCVVGLFFFMTAGSLVRLSETGVQFEYTFSGRALCIMPYFAAALVLSDANQAAVRKWFSDLLILAGLMMLILLVAFDAHLIFSALIQVYHTPGVIIAAAVVGLLNTRVTVFAKLALVLASSALFVITGKHTHLIWIAVIIISAGFFMMPALIGRRRISRLAAIIGILAVCVLLGIVIFYVARDKAEVATGDARWLTYAVRLSQFENSPIVGTKFLESPLLRLEGFGWDIPTHNDYLDIMSGGGLIALALFMAALAFGAARAVGWLRRGVGQHGTEIATPVFAILSMINFFSNPMLHLPATAASFWAALAVCTFGLTPERDVRKTRPRVRPSLKQRYAPSGPSL